MRTAFLTIAVGLLVGASTSVYAQDSEDSQEAADQIDTDALDHEARARYELGRVHLNNGNFAEAASEFEAAHRLSQRDILLWNIYLAHRDAGNYEPAANALQQYLDSAGQDHRQRANLLARVRSLRAQAAAAAGSGGPAQDTPPTEDEPEESSGGDGGSGPSVGAIVVLSLGGAALITGAITGGVAIGISDDLAATCSGGVCPAGRQSEADTGAALAITTDILIPVGIAAIAAGVIWLAVSLGDDSSETAGLQCGAAGCGGSF